MFDRVATLKSILWAIVGVWAAVTAARFLNGLGATTNLSDGAPWGLWIAFDVMGGVALAAGGFVIAATVYIFGLERYRAFVRPAILTAFLGYVAVAVGLVYDLGLPWNIWHPMIYWQERSVLFEVAMCVMLYLTVLALEFAPVVLEHPLFGFSFFQSILNILKRATILLVIAGIILSTLHQSSLGSLFLIVPYRLHPLWYSPIVYVLFFISAAGLGLMMVTLESLLSAYFFGHKVRTGLLGGLGIAASFVLAFYAILRLGDLAIRGEFGQVFSGSWQSFVFIAELLVSAIIPASLLAIPRVRTSIGGLAACAVMTVFGMVMYRFDVCLVAFERPEGVTYFPAWTEIAVSLGVVSAAALVFVFFIENLKVYDDAGHETRPYRIPPRPSYDPATLNNLLPYSIAAPQRYSLLFVAFAALSAALLPKGALFGSQPERTPVQPLRTVDGFVVNRPGGRGQEYVLPQKGAPLPAGAKRAHFLTIDGNRDKRFVLFDHDAHVAEAGGENSCSQCHHENMPFASVTECFECHRDMYETTDIFDHALHVRQLGDKEGCVKCHADASAPKTRETAVACATCHEDMVAKNSRVAAPKTGMTGFAPGYTDAMHQLCIDCHKAAARKLGRREGGADHGLTRCDACHLDTAIAENLKHSPPYVP